MNTIDNIRKNIIGIDKKFFLPDGTEREYIFFDNGASTPSFAEVHSKVGEFLEYYSAVHRGNGYKSFIATEAYDEAHKIIGKFFGATEGSYEVIMLKNTTEAINKLSYRLGGWEDDAILISGMEHHSNDLPWRRFKHHEFVSIKKDGSLDLEDLENKAKKLKGKLKLITVTGASNVTGIVNDYRKIAKIAHENGAKILLDAAQLSPHRKINMMSENENECIDFLVMSGHKMYAPYGTGILICLKDLCRSGEPEYVGGGVAKLVTRGKVYWNDGADREEAGSPNVVGAIALAKAIQILDEIGMDKVAQHEIELTKHLNNRLKEIPEIKMLAPIDESNFDNRLGVFTFELEGVYYQKVAAALCYEYAIGVRCGRFCAHPYTAQLLNVGENENATWINDILHGDKKQLPGALRVSFGVYNTLEEIDILIEALKNIAQGNFKLNYTQNISTGEFHPVDYDFKTENYFKF